MASRLLPLFATAKPFASKPLSSPIADGGRSLIESSAAPGSYKLAENKNTKLGHRSIEHLCHAIEKMVAGQQEPQKKANLAPTA